MPIKRCAVSGCRRMVPVGTSRCAAHQAAHERDRIQSDDSARAASPARKWYRLAAWAAKRRALLEREPLCRMCPDGSKRPATIADHVIPHRGDHGLFWFGELQALCKPCHDIKKQRLERRHRRA